jgi:hypothetical protein
MCLLVNLFFISVIGEVIVFIVSSCLYKLMNFDSEADFDKLIGRLLAFVVMF